MTTDIELRRLRKVYGTSVAVDELSVKIAPGKMLALLGPSGCGKTTTLRMLAGFIAPTAGTIHIGGRDITALPAHRRDTGLVFQNYALFPHLTTAENIGFGLDRRGVPKGDRDRRVAAIIDKLKLTGLADRLPRQLSGGQQQRVAVARALVINPSVLLLDEPFSNLDSKLRESTGLELSRLQREFGLTSIFVTHDQSEAMSIADAIAVMKDGLLQQIGAADEIYDRPANRFVAEFIGRANFLPGRVAAVEGSRCLLELSAGSRVPAPIDAGSPTVGARVEAMVRPEALTMTPFPGDGLLEAVVEARSFQGPVVYLHARLTDATRVVLAVAPSEAAAVADGATIGLTPDADKLRVFFG